jgi:hypothetical protein
VPGWRKARRGVVLPLLFLLHAVVKRRRIGGGSVDLDFAALVVQGR